MIQVEITTTEVGVTEQVTTLVEIAGAGPQGPIGPVGPQGPQGEPGVGILPDGGDTNALLFKVSPANGDADWTNTPTLRRVSFDTANAATLDQAGDVAWDDLDQALSYRTNGLTVDIGQENLVYVRNPSGGSTIPKGAGVAVDGASSNRLRVKLCNAAEGGDGCKTLGVAMVDIPSPGFGFVSTFGLLRGYDTGNIIGGNVQPGAELFISTTPGVLSTVPAASPARRVTVGYVVTTGTQGSIFVTVRRGLTVNELDNVLATNPADKQVIRYSTADGRYNLSTLGTAADAATTDFDPAGSASSVQSNLTTHIQDATNPHSVTKTQVGLGNVDNTSDLNKPISTATQTALNAKADKTTQVIAGTGLDGGGDLSQNRTLNLDAATIASLGKADSAIQSGDNVSLLTNDAQYINAAGAPVQSVNTKTGTVTLSAADVGADPSGSAAGVQSNLDSHTGATTNVHGIANTADLVVTTDARLSDERVPTDGSVTDAKVSATAAIAQSKIANLVDDLTAKANLVNGKIPNNELPAIAITETYVVADIAARDALTPDKGDVAIVQNKGDGQPASYIYDGTAWQKLLTPLKGVSAVTGVAPISSTGGDTPAISLDNGGVTEAKLADGAVTNAKVATNAAIAPSKISGTAVVDNDARLTDERTPLNGSVTDAKITGGGLSPTAITGTAVVDNDSRLTNERTPTDGSVTDAKITAGGLSPTAITGTAVVTNDARLTDQRTPLDDSVTDAKVATNANIAQSKIANLVTDLGAKAANTITVTGTDGLEGGGDLTANRTIKLTAASIASLALADSALQSGAAGTAIAYNNTASGLTATTVQAAIDEIVGILANVLELNTGS